MAIKAHLTIDQGTDFTASIDLVDGSNQAFDLTGYTAEGQIRKNYASETAYDFTITHNDNLGRLFLEMDRSITNSMEPGRYLYDVEIKSSANTVKRVVEGIVTVTPGITRS